MIENFGLTGGLKGDFYPQLRSGSGESVETEPLTNMAQHFTGEFSLGILLYF